MKKVLALLLLFVMVGAGFAQTLKLHRGQLAVAAPASDAGEIVYSRAGNSLNIFGIDFAVAEIDSIVVNDSEVLSRHVSVIYDNDLAWVEVSADVASLLDIKINGANVEVWADALLQDEVTYELSGISANGSFFMEGEYKSTLVLNNLTLTNPAGAAIDIANGKRLKVELPALTTTVLEDGAGGTHKACFFVNGHPEFEGAGTLVLRGNTKHAFASDEYTQIKPGFGKIQVEKSVGDGMHVEQYFLMQGGEIKMNGVGGDGIDVSITKTPTDSLNGQCIIEAGSIDLKVDAEDVKGLKCDSAMTISGGTIKAVVSGNGTKGISVGTNLLIQQKTATATLIDMSVTGTTYMPGDAALESKCRGIKVKGDFTFDGGAIKISATGVKSKAVSVDGKYVYKSGSINCYVDANG